MDIDNVEPTFAKREFLAVLIAGFGNELQPLTSDHGDEAFPKALLPVANKPLLEYVLNWLEQAGITDILLICPAIHRPALYHHIHSSPSLSTSSSSASLRIDLQTYEETPASPAGTCELLRHFSNRITEDFVLVPCDFISPASLPLSSLLNQFRVESGMTGKEGALVTTCWTPVHIPDKNVLSDEWGPSPEKEVLPIVWDKKTASLLHIETADDVDRNGEELELAMGMISRFPHTRLTSQFLDSHVYICQRRVLSMLHQKKEFDSFRKEFLPWLCRNQYRSLKFKSEGKAADATSSALISQSLALNHSTTVPRRQRSSSTAIPSTPSKNSDSLPKDSDFDSKDSDADTEDHEKGSSKSEKGEDDDEQEGEDKDECWKVNIVIHDPEEGSEGKAMRANTLYNYLELNRQFLQSASYALPTDPKDRVLIDQKANISSDVIVGESTQIHERTTIKKSTIGKHCVIGKFVKITGCVILDHVVVEDGAKLDGCIIGKNSKIGAKAELSRCISCGGFEVGAGDVLKGEKLDISDWTADADKSIEESEEENSESDA